MGYYDISVVVDGALDSDEMVSDDGDALDRELESIREQHREDHRVYSAERTGTPVWEVYVLHHDHDMMADCGCAQYVQDHHPALVLKDGAEVDG